MYNGEECTLYLLLSLFCGVIRNKLIYLFFLSFLFCTSLFFLEDLHARYKDVIQAEYERVIEQCMEEINRVKVGCCASILDNEFIKLIVNLDRNNLDVSK